jgi:hypothetical protein
MVGHGGDGITVHGVWVLLYAILLTSYTSPTGQTLSSSLYKCVPWAQGGDSVCLRTQDLLRGQAQIQSQVTLSPEPIALTTTAHTSLWVTVDLVAQAFDGGI